MGIVIGVVIGYAFGTHAGEEGWAELEEAWKVIVASEEVRDLVATSFSMARSLVERGGKILTGTESTADIGLRRAA
jgi:hypothetical protein